MQENFRFYSPPPFKLIKSVNETFVMLQNIYVTNKGCSFDKVQGSLLFVTYTIIQGIISSEMLVDTEDCWNFTFTGINYI